MIRKMWRGNLRLWANVFAARSRGESLESHFDEMRKQSEWIGIQTEDAPLAKLLFAIITQAQHDGMKAVSFDYRPENERFKVRFWRECYGFEPEGAMTEAIEAPNNLAQPLFSHAIWILNHLDPIYSEVRGLDDSPPAKWPASAPHCRCWLRDPMDASSLVIQLLD